MRSADLVAHHAARGRGRFLGEPLACLMLRSLSSLSEDRAVKPLLPPPHGGARFPRLAAVGLASLLGRPSI